MSDEPPAGPPATPGTDAGAGGGAAAAGAPAASGIVVAAEGAEAAAAPAAAAGGDVPATGRAATSPPPGLRIRGAIGLCGLWLFLVGMTALEVGLLGGSARRFPTVWTVILAHAVGTFGTLWVGLRLAGVSRPAVLPLRRFPPRIVPGVLLLAAGAVAVLVPVMPSLARSNPKVIAGFEAMARNSPLGFLFLLVVAAPVLEELLFRGLLLRALLRRSRPLTAVLVSSALFSLVHFNPPQSIAALVLGLAGAWLVLRTGSLLSSMLLHAGWNATAGLLLPVLLPHAAQEVAHAVTPHIPAWVPAVGALALVLAGTLLWWQLRDAPGHQAESAELPRRSTRPLAVAVALPLLVAILTAAFTGSHRGGPRLDPALAAGCYELSGQGGELTLFDDSVGRSVQARLTLVRKAEGTYLLEPIPARPGRATPDVPFWAPASGDSLRLVRMRPDLGGVVVRLQQRPGGTLAGTSRRYQKGGNEAGAPRAVVGRRIPCPGNGPGAGRETSPPA